MIPKNHQVLVCGHVCLDLIPDLGQHTEGLAALLEPGKLVDVGPVVAATGRAVSNTGLALHRLGLPAKLVGKVGDDLFGLMICSLLAGSDPAPVAGMLVEQGVASSYTIVISVPGVERIFLHCPGANNAFRSDDVSDDALAGARVLHFGCPPLMRHVYSDAGNDLAALFARARTRGLITSLDVARPDPASEAGRVDWWALLARILPQMDLFLPSLEKTLLMLKWPTSAETEATLDA